MPGGGSRAGAYVHQIEAKHVARRLSQPMTVACGICGWSVSDTVEVCVDEDEGRRVIMPPEHPLELAAKHRLSEHGIRPWRRPTKRRTAPGVNLSYIRQNLNAEEQSEIDAEVARRRRLHGIDA